MIDATSGEDFFKIRVVAKCFSMHFAKDNGIKRCSERILVKE